MTSSAINPLKILLILLIIALGACGLFEDEENESYTSPRDMTWTVDTIAAPGTFQTALSHFWGDSPKNLYVAGHTAGVGGELWHYDGNSWSDQRINSLHGGLIAPRFKLHGIWGSAADNIWAVGSRLYNTLGVNSIEKREGVIIHYDGTVWSEVDDASDQPLYAIWGRSADEVYAVGGGGTVQHYDGQNWELIQLPDSVQLNNICGDEENIFIQGSYYQYLELDNYYMFRIDKDGWQLQDYQTGIDNHFNPRFGQELFSPESGHIYSTNWVLFEWNGSGWDKIYEPEYWMFVGGTAHDNILVAGTNGFARHWNGQNWQHIDLPTNLIPENDALFGIWMSKEEAFLATYGGENNATFIIHGK